MNLPIDFENYMRSLLGEEEYEKLAAALRCEAPVSIRINGRKIPMPELSSRVPWCTTGFYLDERLTFTFDPLFHAGCYYVQEASSMFVEQAIRACVSAPVRVLDLCAAPGGKSTLLRSLLPDGSLLVSNEVVRNRSQVLAENLTKWGYADVAVTRNEPADFAALPAFFDVILTDVPCSGEGMFRKDEGAIEEWSAANVQNCCNRQREILEGVWEALKPGGHLIYSTCTYNLYEDEENVAWMMEHFGAEVLPLPVEAEWGITGNLAGSDFPVSHFLPHRTRGEGFFLALLRKPDDASATDVSPAGRKNKAKGKGGKNAPRPIPVPTQCKGWLQPSEEFGWEVSDGTVRALPLVHEADFGLLQQHLNVLQAGVTVAELKGKDCIPHQSLAMSCALNRDAFPQAEVTYGQAIAYLRKESIALDADVPRGYVLLTYRDVPLGFVKNLGNRANNLYPQEWRIRSGYLPEEIRCL